MEHTELCINNGLFPEKFFRKPSLIESPETLSILMKTIKEYRDFAHPGSNSWENYIQEFFQLVGFHTIKQSPRLLTLQVRGSKSLPCTLVGVIFDGEDLSYIAPHFIWETFIFFASKYYKVDWGIITNGLQLKVFNFAKSDNEKIYFWSNLEEIIINSRSDSFSKLYKIFTYIKNPSMETKAKKSKGRSERKKTYTSNEYDLDHHIHDKPSATIKIFGDLRIRINSLSDNIVERFHKKYIGYSSNKNFCQIHFQKKRLKICVNLDIEEISDHLSLCRDMRKVGHYGTGNTEILLQHHEDIDAIFEIIKQAYNNQ